MKIDINKVKNAVAKFETRQQQAAILRELLDELNGRSSSTPLPYAVTTPTHASYGHGCYRIRCAVPIIANSDY